MSAQIPINNIIPFSLVDGPGARCSIFVQGCNLRCSYCHNPETQALCISCGTCVRTCPTQALTFNQGIVMWDPDTCIKCDTCINVCEHRSSPRIRRMDAREVFDEVTRYQPFIRGVTTSGGECMLYPDFLLDLFSRCKSASLGALIDSNGTIDFSQHEEVLEVADGVMIDVKAWDDAWFVHMTGSDGKMVRQNLAFLADCQKLAEIRVIVTEEWNDPEDAVQGIARTLGPRTHSACLRLMCFRPFGVRGPMEHAASPSDARMDAIEHAAHKLGFGEVVVS